MTLEGAINLSENNDYVVYTMNSVTTGQYGVVVPKNVNSTLNMLVDLHMKSSFDGVGNGTKTKEQLVSEIGDEYNNLKSKYAAGMLVMPMIDEGNFQNIVNSGDKQKMFDEVKKIGTITSELYKNLTAQGVDKQNIDQKIIIVEKNQEDEKFVEWLKGQMPNFVDGILYSEVKIKEEAVNPFVNDSSIFGPAVNTVEDATAKVEASTAPVSNGGIFDNVAPSASVAPVAPVVSPEPVVPVAPTPEVVLNSAASEPVSQTPVVDLFGSPVADSVAPAPEVVNTVQQENTVVQAVAPSVQPAVSVVAQDAVAEGPKPVNAAELEGTIAFTPIPNHPNNPVETPVENTENSVLVRKKSKGFVNLAILLVVLVGVTLISIELGKYLYNVYGA